MVTVTDSPSVPGPASRCLISISSSTASASCSLAWATVTVRGLFQFDGVNCTWPGVTVSFGPVRTSTVTVTDGLCPKLRVYLFVSPSPSVNDSVRGVLDTVRSLSQIRTATLATRIESYPPPVMRCVRVTVSFTMFPSSSAVTVTSCGVSQSVPVNMRVVGLTSMGASSGIATETVAVPLGCLVSRTAYRAPAGSSSTITNRSGSTSVPRLSGSRTITLTSGPAMPS